MVLVELLAEVVSTNDVYVRYFTIETTAITSDYTRWANKVMVGPGTGSFYSRQVDLPEGSNTIWVGVTNFVGTWTFRVRAKVVSTGNVFADINDHHPAGQFVNSYTISVPRGGTTTTTTFDPSEIISQMMNTMMPMMMQIMGMSMMVNMMAGMMQSLTQAF
jgi:hypothetical protein